MIKYRIIEYFYENGKIEYRVQKNVLFGLPGFWFTASFYSLNPPHPDLSIPANCILNCVFSNIKDAIKCYNGFTTNNLNKIISKKIVKFDYRGLIDKGLALEALEGMYGKEAEK